MKRLAILLLAVFCGGSLFPAAALAVKSVHVITIDGIINPGIENFVNTSIEQAKAEGSRALVIELDTPGGMLSSTKDIVKLFFDSEVPIVVFVSPAGASATSAGMMVTVAGHVAVMSPGTNIGAAHPVIMPFGVKYEQMDKEDVMLEKATKDTVGWVRSICEARGRNADWAERAVAESESVSALEALELGVVDGVVKDLGELIEEFLPGREVKMKDGSTLVLDTKGARIVRPQMTTSQKLQNLINNPNVILVLLLLGGLGVALEFKNPGLIFPAVIGAAMILVALLAPSLSINYIGLFLIVLAFALLVTEIFVTSYGLLTVCGMVSLVVGSMMLFDTADSVNVMPSFPLIISIVIFVTAVILIFGVAIVRAYRHKVMTGYEEMIGELAQAESDIGPQGGKIFVHGEIWRAFSETPIAKGETVMIKSMHKLNCLVEKADSIPAFPGRFNSRRPDPGNDRQ